MNPKPSTRPFFCPRCNGIGTRPLACGADVACSCDHGLVERDAGRGFDEGLRPFTASRRRWTGLRHPAGRDWLEVMAQLRARMAATLRQYPDTNVSFTEYGFARLCAMRPKAARLRQCDMLAMAARCVGAVEAMRRAA
jgi:hypothetical protein